MRKCRRCLCRSCLNTCGCIDCRKTGGTVTACDSYSRYEQMSFVEAPAKPTRKKLTRFFTWDDYGISRERYKELCTICHRKEYAAMMQEAADTANKDIAEYILLSVKKNKSYEGVEYAQGLGRIPCGRTDFYGYRRLFYHILDGMIREQEIP